MVDRRTDDILVRSTEGLMMFLENSTMLSPAVFMLHSQALRSIVLVTSVARYYCICHVVDPSSADTTAFSVYMSEMPPSRDFWGPRSAVSGTFGTPACQ